MKRFTISLVLVLFVVSAVFSYYSAECMKYGFDFALFSVQGVICTANIPHLKYPHMLLRDVIERENTPKKYNPMRNDPLPEKDI